MSRIKRELSEKMLSGHDHLDALEHRSVGVTVNGWDAFFQYASTPAFRYRDD